ncbi:unnamed protein product [Durusdinium trenchii]|uniref:Uncharacterized protein n=1 Tax=Durusdinium trenchii TaxID=1381693 RepID=A0ABP0SV86_9DINO
MATVVLGQTLSAEVEAAIAKDPALKARLDEAALLALARANPERAVQVIEELQNKSNVRNPSAFVAATLAKNPTLRTSSSQPSAAALQQAGNIQELLKTHPDLQKALDASAVRRLSEVDLPRATELIEELANRPDVRNPSAFVVHSLSRNAVPPSAASTPRVIPPPGETILDAFPAVAEKLDDRARARVLEADPVRAKDIVNEILKREDLQNPSAFVMKSLSHSAHAALAPPPEVQEHDLFQATQVEQMLQGYPHLRARLDTQAVKKMRASDLSRVQEILQALADFPAPRRDVPQTAEQAMLATPALLAAQYMLAAQAAQAQLIPQLTTSQIPQLTTQMAIDPAHLMAHQLAASQLTASQLAAAQLAAPQMTAPAFFLPAADPLQQMLALHPTLAAQLDERARSTLEAAEPARAIEVLEDIIAKGDVRNPSAFVAASLSKFRERQAQARERSRSPRREGPSWVDQALLQYPHIDLDLQARRKLESIDPSRGMEMIEDLARRTDIRNPSAFVIKAANATMAAARTQDNGTGQAEALAAPAIMHTEVDLETRAARFALDDDAKRTLRAADLVRAHQVLDELEAKGTEVRNPSAFVCTSLSRFRTPRFR